MGNHRTRQRWCRIRTAINRSQPGFEGDLPPVVGRSVDEYVYGRDSHMTVVTRASKPADNL